MRKILILISLILALTINSYSQISLAPSVVASGGNYYESQDMTISWTIGDLTTATLTGTDLVLTQGFEQPFGIGTGIQRNGFEGEIFVYPNPVEDQLNIRFDIERSGNYILELQDVTGRIISQTQQKPINPGNIIQLNTSSFSPGIYLLKVVTTDGRSVQVTSLRKM